MFNLKNTNPFADIKKEQLAYGTSMKSKAYGVKIETPLEEDRDWAEVGVVSDNYLLVPNKDMVNTVESILDESEYNFNEGKTFWNGKVFSRTYLTDDVQEEVTVGDPVRLGIQMWNSYDGSVGGALSPFVERLICNNGMTSKKIFSRHRFKHTEGNENWNEEFEKVLSTVNDSRHQLVDFARQAAKLTDITVNVEHLQELRKNHLNHVSDGPFGQIMHSFLTRDEYQDHKAWDLLNAGTDLFWHRKTQTVSDFNNNEAFVDGMLNWSDTVHTVNQLMN